MRPYIVIVLAMLAVGGCRQRDMRAEHQAECRQVGGVYHMGEDWDDDVCVITRERVILFDNREPKD